MFDYIQKFAQLDPAEKSRLTAPAARAAITDLEQRYQVSLASLVMKIAVGVVSFFDLPVYFRVEYGLDREQSEKLAEEIREKIFEGRETNEEKVESEKPKEPENNAKLDSTVQITKPINQKSANNFVPSPAAGASSFFFSAEDEEEIKQIAGKIETSARQETQLTMEEKIKQIVKESKIYFSASYMEDRFYQIMKTYLLGIRDRIETKLALSRDSTAGGMEFNSALADRVMMVAQSITNYELPFDKTQDRRITNEKVNEQIPNSKPQVSSKWPMAELQTSKIDAGKVEKLDNVKADNNITKDAGEKSLTGGRFPLDRIMARDIDYDLAGEIKKRQGSAGPSGKKETLKLQPPTPAVIGKKTSIFVSPLPAANQPKPAVSEPAKAPLIGGEISVEPRQKPPTSAPAKETRPVSRPAWQNTASGKIKMEDVRHVPLSLDPIDELHYMTIVNFRRLSQEPAKAAAKIKEKIELLKKNKLTKGLEGIKAWRQSPVSRLYLEMGQECIEKKADLAKIVEERKTAGLDFLEPAEFHAIMDLNKGLRF